MRTPMNILAWAPGLLLAASLPATAVAQTDRAQQPQQMVGQLSVSADERERDHEHKHERADQTAEEARMEARIDTTLSLNRSLQRSDIRVEVADTTAVLKGTVDDDLHKELAEELAMNVDGIDRVDNKLEVDEEYAGPDRDGDRRSFAQTVEDATTTTAVRSRLLWSRNADGVNTEVETRDGKVTLSGTAESAEAKQMAETLARNAWGVTSVTNNITVDPEQHGVFNGDDDSERTAATQDQVAGTGARVDAEQADARATARADADDDSGNAISDAWITTKVRSSFLTSRWISSTDISIETNDGVVALSGEIDSPAERDLAIEVAENIRGVRNVDARNLTVIS